MKLILQLEELAMFGLSIFLFSLLDFEWWWYLVLFFAPDLGMLGYLINTKAGAFTYNVLHHKMIAIMLYLAGIYWNHQILQLAGVILFGHASFDRIVGYGLKYTDSFQHTHLGIIGKK